MPAPAVASPSRRIGGAAWLALGLLVGACQPTSAAAVAPQPVEAGFAPSGNRLGCSPAVLASVSAEPDRNTPRAKLLHCAARAAARTAGTDGTSSVVVRAANAMVAAGGGHAAVELACDLGSPWLLVSVGTEVAGSASLADAARLAAAIDELRVNERAKPAASPRSVEPQILPPPPLDTSALWTRLGVRQAALGDLAQAERSATKAGYGGRLSVELAAYDWLRQAGRTADAAKRLAGLDAAVRGLGFDHSAMLVEVAMRMAAAGDADGAAALLRQERARTTTGKWGAGSRAELSAGLVRLGLVDEALRLEHDTGQEQTLCLAVRPLIDAGQLAHAQRLATGLLEPSRRAEVWTELAAHYHASHDEPRADECFGRAEREARQIAMPRIRVEALGSLAADRARAGRAAEANRTLDDALRDARAIADPEERRMSLDSLVGSCAQAGQCTRALQLGREVGGDGFSVRDVATRCTNGAELDAIVARLGDIRYQAPRAEALAALATRYAEAGAWPRALELIGQIDVAEQRALALSALALLAPTTGTLPDVAGCEVTP